MHREEFHRQSDRQIYFPKVDKMTNTMEFYQIISIRQLERGYMDILEPKEDMKMRYKFQPQEDTLAVLPGVAFDTSGYRVGYGKGFYDKKNAACHNLSAIICIQQYIISLPVLWRFNHLLYNRFAFCRCLLIVVAKHMEWGLI